jgi:hypothetical protein
MLIFIWIGLQPAADAPELCLHGNATHVSRQRYQQASCNEMQQNTSLGASILYRFRINQRILGD